MERKDLYDNPNYWAFMEEESIGNFAVITKEMMIDFLKSKGKKGLAKLYKEDLYKIIKEEYWQEYLERYNINVPYGYLKFHYFKKIKLDYYAIRELECAGLLETVSGDFDEDTNKAYYKPECVFAHTPEEWRHIWHSECQVKNFEMRISCDERMLDKLLDNLRQDFDVIHISQGYGERKKKYYYLSCSMKRTDSTERKENHAEAY